jgi:outer membrane murein-binding lipoprotein Lpp
MTDLTLENLQAALRPLHSGVAELRNDVTELRSRVDGVMADMSTSVDGLASDMAYVRTRVDGLASDMAEVRSRVDGLASDVDSLASDMANVRIRVDGLPLLGVAVETLRQDMRMTRAAISDMARVNITAGEVEAMHTDISRTMARQDAIETRLATLERRGEQPQHQE